ncbi:phosphotransferase [Virgibacillus dakarensis]|nr:phosphotransferase [Virgibacillus dakarensis]
MNAKDIVKRFGLQIKEEPVSIYPFSPVFRVPYQKGDVIVKRTQRCAKCLINYTTSIKENGIQVVTPVPLATANPQKIGNDTYVVYPFIKGFTYSGKDQEIVEAGELLGRIHSLSPKENTFALAEYDVFDFTDDEVEESMQAIERSAEQHNIIIDSMEFKQKLLEIVRQQNIFKNSNLPSVATPHDFKANNLIYTPEPYLIDPDNAIWIPRIFDLALALLLFHNELSTAPDTIFTPRQWKLFLNGYKANVQLTNLEKEFWQEAIGHVFLDEVMWLMANVEEDWERVEQRKLFESLIKMLMDPVDYGLDM